MKNLIVESIGNSRLGQPILIWQPQKHELNKPLILGGVHGDEIEGIFLANELLKFSIIKNLDSPFTVIPTLNPDGFVFSKRQNYTGVDLNRNMPTKNWGEFADNLKYYQGPSPAGEPETQALLLTIDKLKPSVILSLHSYETSLVLHNEPQSLLKKIETLARNLKIRCADKMNYGVSGSLTIWGKEHNMPVVTLEILKGLPKHEVLGKYLNPIIGFLDSIK